MPELFARAWLAVLFAFAPLVQAEPLVAIIIDDLGNDLRAGRQVVDLPGPVVCSVLPHTPGGARLARLAHARGKEVFLHLPLQAVEDEYSSEYAISLDTSRSALAMMLGAGLDSVPHAIGVNGHRGSLVTRHPGHMAWLMEELSARNLLFVDSFTTHHSVALKMAEERGLNATRRDVFLDDDRRPGAIRRQFERFIALAERRGRAVAIGHPYPETLAFLKGALPELERRGVRLVGIRQILEAGLPVQPPATVAPGDGAGSLTIEPVHGESF